MSTGEDSGGDLPPGLNGASAVYGLLGHPVAHSLSPAMHNAAFRALGINAVYVPFPVAGLCSVEVRGFNLTVPHKTAIVPLLAELTPEASAIGAVNTVRNDPSHPGGRLAGTNTDGIGFLRSLEQDLGFDPREREVLLLGAGGAARAIAFALLEAGAARLVIANRTVERAQALAADCAKAHPGAAVEGRGMDGLSGLAPHLLVNSTTVGMGDGRSPVAELAPLGVREAVAEIVYHPLETPLMRQAQAAGLATTNGIGMLLHQGAAAFTFWTGREAPVDVMRAALLKAMGTRGH